MSDPIFMLTVKQVFPPYLLNRLVNKRSLAYLELRDSIKEVGLINSICVRVSPRKEGWFELIDGMRRWSCAKDLELETIPAILKEADDAVVLRLQLQANAIRLMAQPFQFASQMKRLFMADPTMTFDVLAGDINKKPYWIKKTLGLLNLIPLIAKRVDRCEIPISSAYMLAKLPKWMQVELEEEAIMRPAKEFCRQCGEMLKEYRSELGNNRKTDYYRTQNQAHPYLQFFRVLVAEWKHSAVGPSLLVRNNVTKPLDAWKLALAWVLHMDPDSSADQIRRVKERLEEQQKKITSRFADRIARQDVELVEGMPNN